MNKDLKKEYDALVSIYDNANKVILTGNQDLDYIILNRLNVSDLSMLCRTNTYAQKLCYNENFWKNKFRDEKLPYTSGPNSLTEWLDLYKNVLISKKEAELIMLINKIENTSMDILNPIDNEDFLYPFIYKIRNEIYKHVYKINIMLMGDKYKLNIYYGKYNIEEYWSTEEVLNLITLTQIYVNDPFMKLLSNGCPILVNDDNINDYLDLYNHHLLFYRKGLLYSILYLNRIND